MTHRIDSTDSVITVSVRQPYLAAEDLPRIHRRSIVEAGFIDGPTYRILDFSSSGLTLSQVLGAVGALHHNGITDAVVAEPEIVTLIQDALPHNYGSLRASFHTSLEDARMSFHAIS